MWKVVTLAAEEGKGGREEKGGRGQKTETEEMENVQRKGKDKGVEKVENRDRCASCIGGLMCLLCECVFVERK